MPSFQKIKSSRVNNAAANVYVGNAGTMFFNSDTGALRLSDGVTPGGQPVTVAIVGNITFGNISVTDTTISTINPNADLTLQSNGTGDVNLVGNIKAFTTAANIDSQPIFSITSDGQVRMLVPDADMVSGALEIVGNDSGEFHPPNQTGVILHVTGNQGLVGRNYFDANDNYALLVGRRYNGTYANVTQVLNNQLFFRIAGQASTNGGFEPFGPCQIDWVATEDQTPTAQGGELRIRATPNGANAIVGITQVAAFNATTGLTVSGNITANAATINGNASISGFYTGKYVRTIRNAGVIADGGTLTIDFSTDAIVYCTWANGMSLAYQNYTAGRVVKVMCTKASGSGTDSLSLDGITAAQVSSGSTSITAAADTTTFIELTCVGTSIGSVFAKL